MKSSKRILAALLALMLVLSLAACAKTPASSENRFFLRYKKCELYNGGVPRDVGEQKRLLRGLLNVRPARGATGNF